MTTRAPEQLDLFREWKEEIRLRAWQAVHDHDCLSELADAIRELNRWTCTRATAKSIVSKWLSPDERRPLPAYVTPIITALTGEDSATPSEIEAIQAFRAREREERKGPVRVGERVRDERKRA